MDIPISSSEKWNAAARNVRKAQGEWVVVSEGRKARNEKAKEALERRGLSVEVTSRFGRGTPERPWQGWRTFARTV